jgi:hypothetical protein
MLYHASRAVADPKQRVRSQGDGPSAEAEARRPRGIGGIAVRQEASRTALPPPPLPGPGEPCRHETGALLLSSVIRTTRAHTEPAPFGIDHRRLTPLPGNDYGRFNTDRSPGRLFTGLSSSFKPRFRAEPSFPRRWISIRDSCGGPSIRRRRACVRARFTAAT